MVCKWLLGVGVLASTSALVFGQSVDLARYDCLQWRCIGPHRGGRTVGADAVWSRPNEMYIGVNNGGVWKTTDYGRTWDPIFDSAPTGSVGCVAVAQSDPKTIYVGSGEGLQRPDLSVGDGVYKTTNGGKTWVNTGLRDGLQIPSIIVDPKNSNRAFAAVLGHPYGANDERGVYRTLDGGRTWKRVLFKDKDTGAVALQFDPQNTRTVYATLWSARQAPWENGQWQGHTSGLFKSIDGGDSWKPLTAGLPTTAQGVGRIGITVCAKDPRRIFAIVDAPQLGGIYRSDDAGEHWALTSTERRLWGRGSDFAEVRVDPSHPNTVFVANTSTYKSTDAGKTWDCIKGAPGGDDYHTIWIHPTNSDIILLSADQGATVSVNGGETWSSWYNQPTAQFYHVITDNQFPYWVYGAQQESGSVGVPSRGPDGQITFRDWHPVGAEEYAYVAPDPKNPSIIFGSKGTRYDTRTGEATSVRPNLPGLRYLRTMPMLFSPVDPNVLFLAANKLLKTTDSGATWQAISPDLSREAWDVPSPYAPVAEKIQRRGVIYAVGPSYVNVDVIWCGTDDGLVWLTQDGGKSWSNVTPPGVTAWSKVAQIDAGRFDSATAYVSVNRLRCDDLAAYVYVTHDFGKTWKKITNGLPNDAPINVVREDPKRRGLLFAGSERSVWFSADDGENWNPLRLKMPATSIRDLVIHEDDLVVGTHGRSFWILDSITALRQLGSKLYTPTTGYLVEWNKNTDTPLPPEEPGGQNPPDGVPIDYYLSGTEALVKLEIIGPDGSKLRQWTSTDIVTPLNPKSLTVDPRWARPVQKLSAAKGSHRFIWDLRIEGSPGARGLGMAAIWFNTPTSRGSMVAPGTYKVRLSTAAGTEERELILKADPRKG